MSIGDPIRNFNKTLSSLSNQLSVICPGSFISESATTIDTIMKKFPEKIIGEFIVHVLPDKNMIDEGNEEFFLKKDYSKEIPGKENLLNDVFQLKEIWNRLTPSNKKTIFGYMKCLCYYAQLYLINRVG